MTQYRLTANEAEQHEYGWTVKFSLLNGPLVTGADDRFVDIRNLAELQAAKHSYGIKVLRHNPNIDEVYISDSPVQRHASGCKNSPNIFVDRDDVARVNQLILALS